MKQFSDWILLVSIIDWQSRARISLRRGSVEFLPFLLIFHFCFAKIPNKGALYFLTNPSIQFINRRPELKSQPLFLVICIRYLIPQNEFKEETKHEIHSILSRSAAVLQNFSPDFGYPPDRRRCRDEPLHQ